MDDIIKNIYGRISGFSFPEKTESYIKRYGGIIFPFLLCIIMMSAGLYIYTEKFFDIYAVLAAAACIGVFALCSYLRKKKFGGLFYTMAVILLSFIPGLMLPGWENKAGFVRWFFSGAQAVATRPVFVFIFIIFFGFFFCSVVYYFTQIVYRSAAVVLISMIPFALAIKAAARLPAGYAVTAAALDLIIFIYYSRKNLVGKSIAGRSSSTLIVYTDFAVAAVILALIVPKPSETPYYEKFEGFLNLFQFGGSGEAVMNGEYNRYSGNADDLLMQESRLLYIIASPKPTYMKTQVFDTYDAENNRWEADMQLNGSKDWQNKAALMNFEKLSSALEKAAQYDENFYERYPFAEYLDDVHESETYSLVYSRQYPAAYVIAPLRSFAVNLSTTGASYSARSAAGEIFTDLGQLPATADYAVRYYDENIFYGGMLESGACDTTAENYRDMLEYAGSVLYENEGGSDELDAVYAFLDEYAYADEYAKKTKTEVSPEIQALADKLTGGLEYDHQKAKAIEQYFYNNGFVYSLAFEAPENSDTAEYFIFTSKTGTCSDFASAFTLLARAAGLTVRYAEGFVPTAGDEPSEGTFYIYSENAHAYPEVFIPGAGWVRYEPTIADDSNGSGGAGTARADDMLTALFTAVIAIICIGVFLLLMILRPKIEEAAFRFKLKFKGNSPAVKMLYSRHSEKAGIKYGVVSRAMTAEELSDLTVKHTGIDLSPLSEIFTENCYGGIPVTGEKRKAAYECYKAQYKEMSRKKKKSERKDEK